MKSASDALKTSTVFKESGAKHASSGELSTMQKVEKMANGLVEKSSDASFTKEKAISLVLQRNPHLYKEYLAEHPKQVQ